MTKPVEPLKLAWASAIYILLLVIPPPPFISQVLDQSAWLTLLLLFGLFILLMRQKGAGWEAIQSISVFALFALLLINKWQTARYDGFMVGGLLPWSDASGYLQAAQRVLNGSLLTVFGARRPLFPAMLAVLLQLTGRNFMVMLAVLTWINALSVLLVIGEVRRSYGAVGAGVVLIFAYEFYSRFAGTTMTEQLGFALGNLGVFFLLVGAQSKSLKDALIGLGLLSLGLNARAGALFILPILIVWLVMIFYCKTGLWRTLGLATAAVASAFILNAVLVKTNADPRSVSFSNFSYTLYGLASGNKGWSQVLRDYPNVNETAIMSLALQKIRSDPTLFLRGILGSYRDYFTPLDGAFTSTIISLYPLQTKINLVLWFLTLTGLVYATIHWRKGSHGLVLASFIGILASVSLVPPIDSDGMRVYATTIPFTALWVVEGLFALISWGRKLLNQKEEESIDEIDISVERLAIGFSVVLIVLVIPAPIVLRFSNGSVPAPLTQTACEPGQQLLEGSLFRNTRIVLIPDTTGAESYMPFIRISDFRKAINDNLGEYPFLDNELLNLQVGQQISVGSGLNGETYWLISDYPLEAGTFRVCGTTAENTELHPYNFYYLKKPSVNPTLPAASWQTSDLTILFRYLYGLGAGILFFLLVLANLCFKQRSPASYLYALGIIVLITPGIFLGLYARAIITLPFAEQRISLQVKDAEVKRGLYILPLGTNWMNQDDLGISPAVVYENGIPLALPNSRPKAIRYDGNGRYSVSNGSLYFSSSDNTDPRTNGRKYELEWPHPIDLAYQWIFYLVGLFGVAMLFFRESLLRIAGTWLTYFRK